MPYSAMMSAVPTEDHAQAAATGDTEALGYLYERFADKLVRYLATRTSQNTHLAEDVAAATWVQVANAIDTYRRRGNGFEAWLFTIARNELNGHYRAAGKSREELTGEMLVHDSPDASETPAMAVERRFTAERVAAEVQALGSDQRECVTLRFFVQLSLEETAAVMGKKPNAIKQLQHRALQKLARRLGDDIDLLLPKATTPAATVIPSPASPTAPTRAGGAA